MRQIYIVTLILIMLTPSSAYANGGSPVLLFISFSVFMVGQVWILLAESVFLSRISDLDLRKAFRFVFSANVVSTIIVGLGFPIFLIFILVLLSAFVPGDYLNYIASSGIYTFDMPNNGMKSIFLSLFWFSITYLLTVCCERVFYRGYWYEIGFKPKFSLNKFVWRANLVSYSGLFLIFIFMWGNELRM
ncbi:hypothetical protein A3K86_22370 [Photobacterium jeanii]|uniref:Uncharacterized protein n=1 Tax=Photobacterium jeanii TaxID=858640 RepID=A0A178K4L7_9GAMM|nr:hypothetical protein [Photobacterium jeanii]OAN11662.1 hypothetical protein A3K86_22370 [Photobacterium jeanii]PST91185.1 hypothetical protein C9I91_11485 [Photobacterium jeanii]